MGHPLKFRVLMSSFYGMGTHAVVLRHGQSEEGGGFGLGGSAKNDGQSS